MAPRKTQARHKNQPSQTHAYPLQQQEVQASDYDSETAFNPAPLPTRTNTELNLSVLRRYLPSITDIPSLAGATDVYTYSPTAQAWERAEMNGTMFICELNHGEGYCVIVLNKKGLDNLVIDVVDMLEVEITTEFLIVRFTDHAVGEERALGFYIHDAPVGTRERHSKLIKEFWEKVMQQNGGAQSEVEILEDLVVEERVATHPSSQVPERRLSISEGQRLSLSDLFRQAAYGSRPE